VKVLLFELATEEIPAAYQKNLYTDWGRRLPSLFAATGIEHESPAVYATARRIAFTIQIAESGKEITETLTGPAKGVALADGKPTPALVGFAKKAGIAPEAVEFKNNGKGEYATATVTRKGKSLTEALPALLHDLISGYRFPRSMRWGDGDFAYARPIMGYTLKYADAPIAIDAKNTCLESIPLNTLNMPAAEYASTLAQKHIFVAVDERKKMISDLLTTAASKQKLSLIENSALLDEVNFLVESPHVVTGEFPADYLRLPDGVILSEMNQHQRYFGLRTADNKLSNKFLIVANAPAVTDAFEKNVRAGNERVLKARLADGAFFFDEDLKRPLADRIGDLKQIVFHEGLGTYVEKTQRMTTFAKLFASSQIAPYILEEAVPLAKADLTTQLVYEFDHLQGEIGAVYAARGGVSAEIAAAIHEHYQPRFQGDTLPASPLGAVISLADKWDNILAAFVLGKEPTSSQDPLAVRRQALYAIQILVAQKISLSLQTLIAESLKEYPKASSDLSEKILQFLKVRLATIFEAEGFNKKLSRAAIFSGSDDVYDLFARATALRSISEKNPTEFDALLTSFKRMANITGQEKGILVDEKLFSESAEHALHDFATSLSKLIRNKKTDAIFHYGSVFAEFAAGKKIVDEFFEKVMVNHDDAKIRQNRLALLNVALFTVKELLDLGELA